MDGLRPPTRSLTWNGDGFNIINLCAFVMKKAEIYLEQQLLYIFDYSQGLASGASRTCGKPLTVPSFSDVQRWAVGMGNMMLINRKYDKYG